MQIEDSMHNWYISAINFEHNDISNSDRIFPVIGEEEEVSPVECRFHTTTVKHHKRG